MANLPADIDRALRAMDFEIVATLGELTFTRRELARAFARVEPAGHWKDRIDAIVDAPTVRERLAIHLAVPFFTGSRVIMQHLADGRFRVHAAGYFAAVGA